jgi:hypothetical protein
MPLVPFVAGQDLTALSLNTAIDTSGIMVYQGADSTPVNNSVVLVSSSYLTLPVVANGFYIYESSILYDGNSTANFQHLIVCPNFSTNGALSRLNITVGGTTLLFNADTSLSTASAGGGVGTVKPTTRSGLLAIGIAGNVSIQFAQNTANASNTVLKQGSWIRLTQVG